MNFTLSTFVHEKLAQAGIPIDGVSHNSKEEPYITVQFREESTGAQKEQAQTIVEDCLKNKEKYQKEWEDEEERKITPEKLQPLVDLLVSKGVVTIEELNKL